MSTAEWLGIYGAALSTVLALTAGIGKWRRRWRLKVTVSPGCERSLYPYRDGHHERHWLTLRIKNRSPQEVTVDAWEIDRLRAGSGPVVTEQTGLPARLEPYGQVEIVLWEPAFLVERRPQRIYAVDARGRKWKMRRRAVEKAIADARDVIELNANREKKPAWVTEEFAKRSKPSMVSSLFGPAEGPRVSPLT